MIFGMTLGGVGGAVPMLACALMAVAGCGSPAAEVHVPPTSTSAAAGFALPPEPQPSSPPDNISEQEFNAALFQQEITNKWISSITGGDLETSAAPGFGSVWTDPFARTVSFAWKGEPPSDVRAKLDSPPPGITVHLATDAPYSNPEMLAAAKKVMASRDQIKAATGGELISAGVSWVAKGLLVGLGVSQPGSTSNLSTQTISEIAGMPVAINESAIPAPVPTPTADEGSVGAAQGDRWHANSPWRSGAALQTPTGSTCSSGFGGYGTGGAPVFLDVAHCSSRKGEDPSKGGVWYGKNGTGATGAKMGDTWGYIVKHDTLLIGLNGTPAGRLYDGPANETNVKNFRDVGGSGWPINGETLCNSGAATGTRCTLWVWNQQVVVRNWDLGWDIYPTFEVQARQSGQFVWGQGDSGGAVFGMMDGTRRSARGMMSTLALVFPHRVDCKGAIPTACANRGWAVPIQKALTDYNVKLATK